MQLFLKPVDVWLFRDGRPFDAMSDHRAQSLFPPFPRVTQGAVRSHYLTVMGVDLTNQQAIKNAVGTSTDFRDLRLSGPLVARSHADGSITRYYPLPADSAPQARTNQFRALTPQTPPAADVLSSNPFAEWLLPSGSPRKPWLANWLDESSLIKYLESQTVTAIEDQELFVRESRFGIGQDYRKRTVKEGALYEVEFIRPHAGIGLWLDLDGYPNWPDHGVMRIGGEGHAAQFDRVSGNSFPPSFPDPLPTQFKLYFATPTFFENGWQPRSWQTFFQGDVEFVAAAIARYQAVGGFDWSADANSPDAHRPAKRYVPAGSVYYFRSGRNAKLNTNLIQNAITDFGAEIGFGQIIIKEW